MKKLPIGKSDFKNVIEDGDYFVDKSLFIKEIITSNSQISLIPRPRRFGKTLNLSMLRYFFQNSGNGDFSSTNEELFKELAIYKEKEFKEHFGKYPVIYISFKDIKEDCFEDAIEKIKDLITEEFGRYYKKINNLNLLPKEESDFNNILYAKASRSIYENSLKLLSSFLYMAYGEKVVILIDEYDTPIHSAYINNYYDKQISFMKNFLSGAFKDNNCLFKGTITGILRVSKESIFSGLNNIITYTILDYEFSDKFGFTTDETKKILNDFGKIEKYGEVSDSYNGYEIGDETIFNPWSIINYVGDKKNRLLPYWANTSSNDLIKDLIKNSSLKFKKNLENLLNDKPVNSELNTDIVFSEMTKDDINIYSLLFFSGYLKCVNKTLKDKIYYCDLIIPNKEVKYIYKNIISRWLSDSFRNERLSTLLESLVEGDIKLFERLFSEYVLETLSYYDVNKKNEEAVYQAFLLGLLVNLIDYEVSSNQESGYGRYDIIILHKTNKDKLAIIMELKTIDSFEEETKEIALQKAITQIEEKKYETKVRQRGYNNILKIGVVFDGKRVWVKR